MNKNLFQPFYNNYIKIIPTLSDDWKIAPSYYIDYIDIKSKKTNQRIQVPISKLVDFLNLEKDKNKLNREEILNDKKIMASFIIDKDLNFISEEEYSIWFNLNEKDRKIQNSKLKKGFVYSLENGLHFIYLGKRFVSSLIENKYISFDRITDIEEKEYIYLHNEVIELDEYIYKDSINQVLTENEVDKIMNTFYDSNFIITYFDKKSISNPKYKFIDSVEISPFLKIGDNYYTRVQNSNNIDSCSYFNKEYKKEKLIFEFELDLNGIDFSQGQSILISDNKSDDIKLVRIGV